MKYPDAKVVGTDISVNSLETCKRNADQIGVKNLDLNELSINEASYSGQFDFIICTGVIHHNANPAFTLGKLAEALVLDGVIELMVHNYYHWILTTAA